MQKLILEEMLRFTEILGIAEIAKRSAKMPVHVEFDKPEGFDAGYTLELSGNIPALSSAVCKLMKEVIRKQEPQSLNGQLDFLDFLSGMIAGELREEAACRNGGR